MKKKKTLLMISNNAVSDPYLHSQLLDIYENCDLFDQYSIFCGEGKEEFLRYANIIENGLSKKSFRRYPLFYYNLVKTLYKNRKNEMTVHLRGFVSAFLFYLVPKVFLKKHKFIYDPRGAFLIERREKNSKMLFIRFLLRFEKQMIKNSLFTIVTTHKFKELFEGEYGFSDKYLVCYNSSSLKYSREKYNLAESKTINICYCGSVNHWHDLDEIHRLITYTRNLFLQKVKVYIFTSTKNKEIVESKFQELDESDLVVKFVDYNKLEEELSQMHVCISVVKPTKSTEIASPIKISDYIMLNKHFILNKGIGDFDLFYEQNNSALLYDYKENLNFTLEDILNLNPERNIKLAEKLKISTNRNRILESIIKLKE